MVRHEAAEALGALGDVASRETIARSLSLARSLARALSLSSSPWLSRSRFLFGSSPISLSLLRTRSLSLALPCSGSAQDNLSLERALALAFGSAPDK